MLRRWGDGGATPCAPVPLRASSTFPTWRLSAFSTLRARLSHPTTQTSSVARPLARLPAFARRLPARTQRLGTGDGGVISPKALPRQHRFPRRWTVRAPDGPWGSLQQAVLRYAGDQGLRPRAARRASSSSTSADSVFQIAAHEDMVPPEQLYEYCRIARKTLRASTALPASLRAPTRGVAKLRAHPASARLLSGTHGHHDARRPMGRRPDVLSIGKDLRHLCPPRYHGTRLHLGQQRGASSEPSRPQSATSPASATPTLWTSTWSTATATTRPAMRAP